MKVDFLHSNEYTDIMKQKKEISNAVKYNI